MNNFSKNIAVTFFSFGSFFSCLTITNEEVRGHVCNRLEQRFGLGPFFTNDLMTYEAHAQVILAVAQRSRQQGISDRLDREDVVKACKELLFRIAKDIKADDLHIYYRHQVLEKLAYDLNAYSDKELSKMLYADQVRSVITDLYNDLRRSQQNAYNQAPFNPSYNPAHDSMGVPFSDREQRIFNGKQIIDDLAAKTNTDEYFSRIEKEKIVAAQKRSLETASESSLQKMTPELIMHRLHQGFSGKAIELGKIKPNECGIDGACCIAGSKGVGVKGCSNWHPNDFVCDGCRKDIMARDKKCPYCRATLANIE